MKAGGIVIGRETRALALVVGAAHVLIAYAVASLAYSLAFKQYPLLDGLTLAALYTMRIVGGGIASQHPFSLWLLAFSGFAFLSLARRMHDDPIVFAFRDWVSWTFAVSVLLIMLLASLSPPLL